MLPWKRARRSPPAEEAPPPVRGRRRLMVLGTNTVSLRQLATSAGLRRTASDILHDTDVLEPVGREGLMRWSDLGREMVAVPIDGPTQPRADGANLNRWNRVVARLAGERPQRPVDAILVVLPAEEVMAAQEGAHGGRLFARGALFHHMVRALQPPGPPVAPAVLIEDSETITGFGPLLAALPERQRRQAFGWSAPLAPSPRPARELAGEAVAAMGAAVEPVVLELLAGGPEVLDHPGDLFYLPQALRHIEGPLALFLDGLLRGESGDQRRALPLDGVFLAGRARDAEGPLCVRELLRERLTPLRPGTTAALWQAVGQRWRSWAGGAALVTAAGLLLALAGGAVQGMHQTHTARTTLTTAGEALPQPRLDLPRLREAVLPKLADTARHFLVPPLLPQAFRDPLPARVRTLAEEAYRRLLLRGLGQALRDQQAVLSVVPLPASDAEATVWNDRITAFIAQVGTLSDQVLAYNNLAVDPQPAPVAARLSRALLGYPLPLPLTPPVPSNQVTPVQATALAPSAAHTVAALAEGYVTARLRDNALLNDTEILGDRLTRAAAADPLVDIHAVTSALDQVREGLSDGDNHWLTRRERPLLPPVRRMLLAASEVPLFGSRMALALTGAWERTVMAAQDRLLAVRGGPLGRLVVRRLTGAGMDLTPPVLSLRRRLSGLSDLAVLQGLPLPWTPLPRVLPGEATVHWSLGPLESAVADAMVWTGVLDKALYAPPAAPPGQRAIVSHLVQDRVARVLRDEVLKALTVRPVGAPPGSARETEAAAAMGRNLLRVVTVLRQALDGLEEVGDTMAARRLKAMMVTQGQVLLTLADQQLQRLAPFGGPDPQLLHWQGRVAPAYLLFPAESPEALRQHFDAEMARLGALVDDFVAPGLTALESFGPPAVMDSAAVQRWQRFMRMVDSYRVSPPAGSAVQLRDFVTGPLMQARADTCDEVLSAVPDPGEDLFQARRHQLAAALSRQCAALASDDPGPVARSLVRRYRGHLRPYFPFSATLPAPHLREAAPATVLGFFRVLSRDLGTAVPPLPVLRGRGPDGPALADFFAALDQAGRFLVTGARPVGPPAWSLRLEVRDPPEALAETVLDVAGLPLYPGGEAVTWTYGQPLRLDLRWREDGPVLPTLSPEMPALTVEGATARLTFPHAWALFALTRTLAAPETPVPDTGSTVLTVTVPVRPNPSHPAPPKAPEAHTVGLVLGIRPVERPQGPPLRLPPLAIPVPEMQESPEGPLPGGPVATPGADSWRFGRWRTLRQKLETEGNSRALWPAPVWPGGDPPTGVPAPEPVGPSDLLE